MWWRIPESIFIEILSYLEPRDILNSGATCRRWNEMSCDNSVWRNKFRFRYKLDQKIGIRPGASSWKDEFKRLATNVPMVLSQKIEVHSHQVLHVSFSHNGAMFATCSKDGVVVIWNADHPCTEKYSHNMKLFSWKYTQYSQFNQSDTLLMVSGVHFGQPHSTSGEIAVFTVDDKHESFLRCRVVNRPYDIFGTWFTDQFLISGDLHWLAHLVSTSVLWLNKASQEVSSEHVPVMNQLYKFYNRNASSIRSIMIAKCPWFDRSEDPLSESPGKLNDKDQLCGELTTSFCYGSHCQQSNLHDVSRVYKEQDNNSKTSYLNIADINIHYQNRFHDEFNESDADKVQYTSGGSYCIRSIEDKGQYDEMENSIPRYLIFSTGSVTYTPHQIGIKRVENVKFPKRLDPGLSLKERIAAKKKAKEDRNNIPSVEPDWWNYDAVADRFDKIDKIIDLEGHIIGMALSPDNRYLYVNTRSWPRGYIITNALDPPPIAQEIDIHVIDLKELKTIGKMQKAHKAYTSGAECFFIFLDVCDNYVASGAEDKHAYLWDRYYGICLTKYKHDDVVNSVAFNRRDSEMLVTTSDDYSIKIWRSREKAKELNINVESCTNAIKLH